MFPEVEQFITIRDESIRKQTDGENELSIKYPNRFNDHDQRTAFYAELDTLNVDIRVAINEAWNGLQRSSDPLVRWIGANCKEYQDEATSVLRVLPATLEDLNELAYGHDWCHVWNRFRDQAIEAGLFGEAPKVSEARKAMNHWLNRDYGMGPSNVATLNRLVDAVVKEETAQPAA